MAVHVRSVAPAIGGEDSHSLPVHAVCRLHTKLDELVPAAATYSASVHGLCGTHSASLCATSGLKVPAGQGVQIFDALSRYSPAAHMRCVVVVVDVSVELVVVVMDEVIVVDVTVVLVVVVVDVVIVDDDTVVLVVVLDVALVVVELAVVEDRDVVVDVMDVAVVVDVVVVDAEVVVELTVVVDTDGVLVVGGCVVTQKSQRQRHTVSSFTSPHP